MGSDFGSKICVIVLTYPDMKMQRGGGIIADDLFIAGCSYF